MVPDRPSSPLQIPAAAAAATGPAAGGGSGGGAGPSEPFSFSRTTQAGAPSTPAAQKAAVPGKLAFSPAATPPAAGGGAAAAAASPALSPLGSTPVGSSKPGGEGTSPLFQMQGNPLFGSSPGASPLAAVPAPALNLAAGAGAAAAAAKPPAQPGSKASSQPPEPPAVLLQQAQTRVSGSSLHLFKLAHWPDDVR